MAIGEYHQGVIKLACGHGWPGQTTDKADVEKFAAMCAATGDTIPCAECGTEQRITEEVEWRP